jgi:type I restriction enzyme S subunit
MPAVDDRKGVIQDPEVRPYREVKKGYTYFASGDVLFAKITPCMQNGKQAIARELVDGIGFGSTEFHVIRPRSEICPEWIHFFIRQPHVLRDATFHFTGAVGQQRVPESFLANLEMPLPPLAEQERIAAILKKQMTAVERAWGAARAQREIARALPAACLREAFPVPTGALPQGWRWVELGEICGLVNGDAYKESDWSSSGTPIIRIQNLNDRSKPFNYWRGSPEGRVRVDSGDLLLAWSGTPGTSFGAHIWDRGPALLNQHIFRVDLDLRVLHPEWLLYALNHQLDELISKAHGGVGLRHVTRKEVDSLSLPLPPIEQQRLLASALRGNIMLGETLRAGLEAQLDQINALPAAFLRKAFQGELV